MTKKGSIFNFFRLYAKTHPWAVLTWLWVLIFPALGSLIALANYNHLILLAPKSILGYFVFTCIAAICMGLALLPTTFTAVLSGFVLGWVGLPLLVLAYAAATVLGYLFGRSTNTDLLSLLSVRFPEIEEAIEKRKNNPGALIFFIRISPVIPFALSNFIFASVQVSLKQILLYGIPGMLPRTILAFLAGILASDFLSAQSSLQDPYQIAFLVFFLLISIWGIWHNWKKSKS